MRCWRLLTINKSRTSELFFWNWADFFQWFHENWTRFLSRQFLFEWFIYHRAIGFTNFGESTYSALLSIPLLLHPRGEGTWFRKFQNLDLLYSFYLQTRLSQLPISKDRMSCKLLVGTPCRQQVHHVQIVAKLVMVVIVAVMLKRRQKVDLCWNRRCEPFNWNMSQQDGSPIQ